MFVDDSYRVKARLAAGERKRNAREDILNVKMIG